MAKLNTYRIVFAFNKEHYVSPPQTTMTTDTTVAEQRPVME